MSTKRLSEDERQLIEPPLLRIDPLLKRFAEKIGATITYNRMGEVSRYLWLEEPDRMNRAMHIGPVILDIPKGWVRGNFIYFFGIVAWKDKPRRHSWHADCAKFVEIPAEEEVESLLERCWAKLKSVTESDLT